MASYNVFIKASAGKELRRLPAPVCHGLVAIIRRLSREPRPPGVEKLRGLSDTYRVRRGDYRVVYEVADRRVTVTVIKIGHRKDVYR